jgi:hypothetical protein
MVGILLSTCDGGEADVDLLESGTGAPSDWARGPQEVLLSFLDRKVIGKILINIETFIHTYILYAYIIIHNRAVLT